MTQNTFSARFDEDPTLSEGPYIDAVAHHTGVMSYNVTRPLRMVEEIQRALASGGAVPVSLDLSPVVRRAACSGGWNDRAD